MRTVFSVARLVLNVTCVMGIRKAHFAKWEVANDAEVFLHPFAWIGRPVRMLVTGIYETEDEVVSYMVIPLLAVTDLCYGLEE